jgi:hypothetical protein
VQAITAGRYGSKQANKRVPGHGTFHFPLYSVKLYEARKRKSDGAVTWRFVKHLTDGHTWYPTVEGWAEDLARTSGVSFEPGLVHGTVETPPPPPPEPEPVVWDEGNDLLD